MATPGQFDRIADVCLAAHAEIKEHGTSEMQNLIRLLLFEIGQELARQQLGESDVSRGLRSHTT